ncbi:hypothetical protein Hanom_Chr01g00071461 [Helianthus anomalus]
MREPQQTAATALWWWSSLISSDPLPPKKAVMTGGGSLLTGGCFSGTLGVLGINSSAQHLRPPFLSAVSATHNEKQVLCG